MKTELEYELPENKNAFNASISIKRGNSYFQSIEKSEDGKLLLGMNFNGQTYYVKSFVSGEQTYNSAYKLVKRDTPVYIEGQVISYKPVDGGILSFAIKNGIPHATGLPEN
jgi:hypothetical protein